jgi:hypothetical protein
MLHHCRPAQSLSAAQTACGRLLSGLLWGLLVSCGGKAESRLPELPERGTRGTLPPNASSGRPVPALPDSCDDNPFLNNCRPPQDRGPRGESGIGGTTRPPSQPPSSGPPSGQPPLPPDSAMPLPIPELSDPDSTPLERASAVLETRCGSCHVDPDPNVCGTCDGMYAIGDLGLMIQIGKIEACRWTDSRIFRRVLDRSMPPDDSGLPAPSTEEFEIVGQFVNGICDSLTDGGPEDVERVAFENLLRQDCSSCHGPVVADAGVGAAPHFIDGVNDIAELINAELILPCDSAASPLVQRLRDASMPPSDSPGPRPTEPEIAAVEAFIDRPCAAR